MRSRFEAVSIHSNNYLRMHGYAMSRFGSRRKSMSLRDKMCVPFVDDDIKRRGRRVKSGALN